MGSTGLAFQVPIVQVLLGFLNLVSAQQMFSVWRYVLLISTIIGAIITPSTSVNTIIIIISNSNIVFFRSQHPVFNKKINLFYLSTFKTLLFTLTIAISLFGFCSENSNAYPVFAQQGYANPRAANGKLACANCHLNQKSIEIEAPQS